MKLRQLSILLLLVLGLGAYIYYGIQKPHEKKLELGEGEVVFSSDTKLITQIDLTTKDGSLQLVKENDRWWLKSPVVDLASSTKVENLLSALKRFRQTKLIWDAAKVEARRADVSQFGLDPAKSTLSLKSGDQNPPVILRLGDLNPTASALYLQMGDKGPIQLASMDLDFLSTQRMDDFREMRFTTLNPQDFQSVKINWNSKILGLKEDKDSWKLEGPLAGLPADPEYVRGQIEKISLIRANTFSAEAPDARLKTAKPEITLTIGFKEGKHDDRTTKNDPRPQGTEIQLFKLPNPKPAKKDDPAYEAFLYFAKSDKCAWAPIAKFHFENFAKNPEEYVKKTFDDFLMADVSAIRVSSANPQSAFEILKEGDNYTAKQGQTSKPADKSKVENLIRQIRNMRAVTFIDRTKSTSTTPSLRVSFELTDKRSIDYVFESKKGFMEGWLKQAEGYSKYVIGKDALKLSDFDYKSVTNSTPSISEKPADVKSDKK